MDRRNLGSYQWDDNEGYTGGWDQDIVRYTDRAPLKDCNQGDNTGGGVFGSSHPAGFMIVLVDGSTRLLAYGIDLEVFNRLGTRGDGQPVEVP